MGKCTRPLSTVCAFGAVAVSLATVVTPDANCSTGIPSGTGLCCEKQCGVCGGQGCGARPGGAEACCSSQIESSGRKCTSDPPPCVMSGGGGGGWPPPDPTNETVRVAVAVGGVVGSVSDRFVSYNLDSGWGDRWNYSDSTLLLLASALGPAHLRVGGTGEDYLVYAVGEFSTFDCSDPPQPMTPYRCTIATEQQITNLFEFATKINASILFGLNDMFGRPTKTKPEKPMCSSTACPPQNLRNAEALVKWAAATDVVRNALYAWELGNELNTVLNGAVGAETQARDLAALAKIVASAWPTSGAAPMLCGPDTHSGTEYSEDGLAWLTQWAKTVTGSDGVDSNRLITTFHMYAIGSGSTPGIEAKFLDAQSLDKIGDGVRAIQTAVGQTASQELWAGETAAANNGGKAGVTDTFLDTFWYADQLGQFARTGVRVFQRQVLLSAGGYPLILAGNAMESNDNASTFTPTPDYWIALLHSRLMGTSVLNASITSADARSKLRVYAHCARGTIDDDNRDGPKSDPRIALMLINLSPDTLLVDTGVLGSTGTRDEWHLTPGPRIAGLSRLQSASALLNGSPLNVLPGPELPTLAPRSVDAGSGPIALSGQSIAFVVVTDVENHCSK